jgi:hypothetical protein
VADVIATLLRKRDFYAGGLMVLFGLFAAVNGPNYRLGTLMHMGPGFLPTALGVILIILGLVIAVGAVATPPGEGEDILPDQPGSASCAARSPSSSSASTAAWPPARSPACSSPRSATAT